MYKGNAELKVIEKEVYLPVGKPKLNDIYSHVQFVERPRLVHVKDNAEVSMIDNLQTETESVFVCNKCGQKFTVQGQTPITDENV